MRCKFRAQASKKAINTVSSLDYSFQQQKWAKEIKKILLPITLSLGTLLWATHEVIEPKIAQAETARVDISVQSQPNETYEALLSRAEASAKAAVQTSFERNTAITEVSIIVLGQNRGEIAPVLSLEISRPQWRDPDIQRRFTYFNNARSLLGYEDVATTPQNPPQTSNPANTNQTPASSTEQNSTPQNQETASPEAGNNAQTTPNSINSTPANSTEVSSPQPATVPNNVDTTNNSNLNNGGTIPSNNTTTPNRVIPRTIVPDPGNTSPRTIQNQNGLTPNTSPATIQNQDGLIQNPSPTTIQNQESLVPTSPATIQNQDGLIQNNSTTIQNQESLVPTTPATIQNQDGLIQNNSTTIPNGNIPGTTVPNTIQN